MNDTRKRRPTLQDIADLLGITKPALYYHFRSREDLVRSILQPLIDEGEAFIAEQERKRGAARASARRSGRCRRSKKMTETRWRRHLRCACDLRRGARA